MQTMPAINWIQRFVGALPVPALALEIALMAMALPVLCRSAGRWLPAVLWPLKA